MERTPRADKVAIVTEVQERLEASEATLLTEYRGVDVAGMSALRRSLRAAGGEYKVYKNTLVRIAAANAKISGLDELLVGPTGIAFVDDDVASVAKTLRDFAKENPDLVIKGGILSGEVLDASQVNALADLPSRDELLSRLAAGFNAPAQQFAALLHATMAKFAYGVQALIDAGGATTDSASTSSDDSADPAEES
jgi:large subunit ribosomal protein L10